MRLLNSCRFKKFCSLLTVMLLMLFSVIPASAAELSTDEKAEVLVGTEYATGMPGCDLGGAYETKYQGEDLDVTLSTSSSSVTVDDYGPERVANTGSVGVNVGGTLGEDISLELGLSWTQNTTDTNIDVSVSTSGVTWNTALSGGAQKAAFTFKPGINFQCPSNKSSVSVTANASYTLDSWDSGREEISLNKSFTCYPDRVS